METILVLTHVDETGSALTKASLEAVTAGVELARQLSATLTIGILGVDATAAAASPACFKNSRRFMVYPPGIGMRRSAYLEIFLHSHRSSAVQEVNQPGRRRYMGQVEPK